MNTAPALWAKLHNDGTPYELIKHLLDTTASALAVWDHWLRPGLRQMIAEAVSGGDLAEARAIISAVAGAHDVGKANVIFQTQKWAGYRRPGAETAYLHDHDRRLAECGHSTEMPPVSSRSDIGFALRRHEAASLMALAGTWPSSENLVSDLWSSLAVGGHHGRFHPHEMRQAGPEKLGGPQLLDNDTVPAASYFCALAAGSWGHSQQALINTVLLGSGIQRRQLDRPLAGGRVAPVTIVISGLIVLADWLASHPNAVNSGRVMHVDPDAEPAAWVKMRYSWFTQNLADTIGIYEDMADPLNDILGEHAATPTDLQEKAQQLGRGLWIVTSPTGEGKTEASMLRHATVLGEGAIVALPTRAVTDTMAERIRGFYTGTNNVTAVRHSYSMLDEGKTGSAESNEWLGQGLRALLAPVTVSTCDQVLLAALKQKHSFLRLLAVANRHIILDEVHTYDAYQSKLVVELLAWWGATDTRVTLLSATLPQAQLTLFSQAYSLTAPAALYPSHNLVSEGRAPVGGMIGTRREYSNIFAIHQTTKGEHTQAAVDLADTYRSKAPDARIGIIVNTVDRAMNIARALRTSGHTVIVLHSRMTAAHRKQITDDLVTLLGPRGNGRGLTVVGTQAIEASLNVDFDQMITDLAPAASLVQRGGRLWRHSAVEHGMWSHQRPRPTLVPTIDVLVIRDSAGTLSKYDQLPYSAQEVQRTLDAIADLDGELHVPDDVQAFVDAAYFDYSDAEANLESDEMSKALDRLGRADDVTIPMRRRRGRGILHPKFSVEELSATTTASTLNESATRFIDQQTVTVLLVDPTRTHPWVWHGTVAEAESAAADDLHAVRQIIGSTLPLPEYKLQKLTGATVHTGGWSPDVSALRRFTPMVLDDLAAYDELLGMTGSEDPAGVLPGA